MSSFIGNIDEPTKPTKVIKSTQPNDFITLDPEQYEITIVINGNSIDISALLSQLSQVNQVNNSNNFKENKMLDRDVSLTIQANAYTGGAIFLIIDETLPSDVASITTLVEGKPSRGITIRLNSKDYERFSKTLIEIGASNVFVIHNMPGVTITPIFNAENQWVTGWFDINPNLNVNNSPEEN